MGTVPRVLVLSAVRDTHTQPARRTASPAHADFGGLSSGAAPVVVSTSCLSRPALPRRRWRVVGWVDILLDVISGVENALREGCPRTTTGVSSVEDTKSSTNKQHFLSPRTTTGVSSVEDTKSSTNKQHTLSPRTTTGVSQCWFSGHFRQVFFNTIALPRINIGADVWGEASIMTSV